MAIKYEENEVGFSMPIDKQMNEKINTLYTELFPQGAKQKMKFKQAIIKSGIDVIDHMVSDGLSPEEIKNFLNI